ncbi:MAG: hypothetical protein JWQ35_1019 [Bacteriovoracaceae bacterium]|nr:hypothetical protein [Bacteriovoracaceae bacterium]
MWLSKRLFLLLFISELLNVRTADARWASKDDLGSMVTKYYQTYKIKKDGTYSRIAEEEVEILREDARMSEGLVRIKYKPDSETFKILEAYTKNGDKKEKVESDSIEDKPLASDGEGFDQTNQITIVFPDVRLGSKIYYKILREYKTVQIPGFFSEYFFLGGDYLKDVRVQIDSELPLFLEINDPTNALRFRKSRNVLFIRNKKPIHRQVIDENDFVLNPETHHWFLVSTSDSWNAFAKPIIEDYEKILSEPLPHVFDHIVLKALKLKTVEAKMNYVTSELANHLRYHGDWRSVRGRNIPRSLKLVASSRFGDCKDFAALTTVILRKLGLDASMAWVNRSLEPDFTPEKLPHTLFNHAILRVEHNKKIYWVDPTNTASFAQGIFEDIIDRPAFILSKNKPGLEKIPAASPLKSSIEEYQEISFGQSPKVNGKIKFTGREASLQAGLAREASNESLRHHFIDIISRDTPVGQWQIENLDLQDRIAKDFELSFEFFPKQSMLTTTAGTGFRIPTPRRIGGIFDLHSDRISEYFVNQPLTILSDIQLKNISMIGHNTLDCSLKSSWLSASRSVRKAGKDIHIQDKVLIVKPLISPREIATPEFADFQEKLIECFKSNILVFNLLK